MDRGTLADGPTVRTWWWTSPKRGRKLFDKVAGDWQDTNGPTADQLASMLGAVRAGTYLDTGSDRGTRTQR